MLILCRQGRTLPGRLATTLDGGLVAEMIRSRYGSIAAIVCSLVLLCGGALAQVTSSNVVGTLTDPANAVVPGIEVQLTDQDTGAARSAKSNDVGLFRFTNLTPGAYALTVKAQGFKSYSQTGIKLASSETRDLGRIVLELGTVVEEVSVTAQATPVQTATSEKSALVDTTQINNVALRGRDMFGLLQMIPGIQGATGGEVAGNRIQGTVLAGGTNNFTVDGVTNMDTGNNGSTHFTPNMDAIAEIKVLTSNYQAEFGRNVAGNITVITKSGTQQFHGSGWWNKRHEQWNANSWANNRNGVAKSQYRYDVFGYSIGGPAYIPKTLNTNKSRLFFFFSQEYSRRKPSTQNTYAKMPTALEKGGDFSQTTDSSGKLLIIKDPTNLDASGNPTPFANNKIDPGRISTLGLSVLNFFPDPNYTEVLDKSNLYTRNYMMSSTIPQPKRNDMLRIDVNLTSKLMGFYRYGSDRIIWDTTGPNYGILNSKGVREPVLWSHPNSGHGHSVGLTYTISPTTVGELTFGKNWNQWCYYATDESQVLATAIPGLPHWYNASTLPNDPTFYRPYLPYIAFSGGQMAGAPDFGRSNVNDAEPRTNWNDIYSITGSVSKVWGRHSLKAGLYFEHTNKVQGKGSYYTGYLNFGSSTSSSLDTGDGFANALLGYVTSYQEGTKTVYDTWFTNIEPYVQDNWRVTRRLTLDMGVRLYLATPYVDMNGTFSAFSLDSYKASAAPRLYTYYTDPTSKKKMAIDPLDSTNIKPVQFVGLYVQDATGKVIGDPANGWKVAPSGEATYSTSFFLPSPRFGFSYDVFGDGKTAIRGGIGYLWNRFDVNQVYEMSGLPPYSYIPQVYDVTLSQLATTQRALGPLASANYMSGDQPTESSINGSFGIQRNVGFGTVVEASYVGAFRRHVLTRYDVNHLGLFPYLDPANWQPGTTTRKADIFLYPLQGQGTLRSAEFMGSVNYNSLQVSANRRFSRGLAFGLAYTFSKTISSTSPTYYFLMSRNRNPSGTPHNLVINYTYELPNLGKRLGSRLLGAVVDNWTLAGITTFSSGNRTSPSISYRQTLPYGQTGGSPDDVRLNVVGDWKLSGSEKTPLRQFNIDAFAPPAPCTTTSKTMACFGTGPANFMLSPAWNNWDVNIAKRIPLGLGEGRTLSFRGEFLNIWNHTEYSGFGTSTQWDLATNQRVTTGPSAYFGQLNAARDPRIISFTLRLEF